MTVNPKLFTPRAPGSNLKDESGWSNEFDGHAVDFVRIGELFMRRPILISAVFAVLFAVVMGAIMSAPKQYTAMAQVQVDINSRNLTDVASGADNTGTGLADAAKIDTEIGMIQSGAVARQVLLDLGPPPTDAKAKGSSTPAWLKAIKNAVHPSNGQPAASPLDPIQKLQKGLKVEREGGGYVIDIQYTATDPAWAAKTANAFVAAYQRQKSLSSVEQSQEAGAYMSGNLADLERQVMQADAAVAAYRASHGLEQAGSTTMDEQNILAIGQQLVSARAAQAEVEARYKTAADQLAHGSNGDDVGEALSSPVVQQLRGQRASLSQRLTELRTRYGSRHPDVVTTQQQLIDIDGQIQAEIRRILSNLSAQVQVARERTASLQASLNGANRSLVGSDAASVKLNELLRNQEAARETYQQYLARFKQNNVTTGAPPTNAHVITPATPPSKPSAPNALKAMAIALAAGLVGGVGTMFGAGLLERTFNDIDEIESELAVPALASIPLLQSTVSRGGKKGRVPSVYVVERPLSVFAESFRTLRTTLQAMRLNGRPVKVVAITSAVPHEGKTTTAVCLARVAALGHAKVLVIDTDLRRRALGAAFGVEADIGLVEVLDGAVTLERALVKDSMSSAMFLPLSSSTSPQRDVLSSPALDKLLAAAREYYDLIILDAAPVLLLADARTLAQRVDATLLLARWRATPKSAVRSAVRELSAVGAALAGVVLTQVDRRLERKSQYGGSQYYRSYGAYFEE
ncbi:GumC family protein [Phenylobacterium montanum]|uniref:non-specific protein-tyrosine kinase n=1 Tax=Phenylobacterium montanum TaxID=2823693 RepID=A0A975IVY0_9CAUL|nr:polysaccharide biosynthesis tyrosine autokinase [Caulobacter sp. S6]QUD89313.1 polysaccharide biosynthesis tyrosine autokinase [Caulobacter sp. S6]